MSRNFLQNTQFQTSNIHSTTIRTNPHINSTYAQLFTNLQNIPPNPSNTPTYNTVSPCLQHIEARVTFPLSLQPTSDHEYLFWHARRMAFILCSLTGTALSWYIRLNDTYKQDWYALVHAFKKNNFPHKKTPMLK